MALRALHANPSLGGFGGESSAAEVALLDPSPDAKQVVVGQDGDAFCQIVKELVDNAIDACAQSSKPQKSSSLSSSLSSPSPSHRVKVEILPYKESEDNILQVIVSDNGCGMDDIQKCVNAFQSTKQDSQAGGRYGIGLTLCLLHSQRLVPNSCACITSATRKSPVILRAFFKVDAKNDIVRAFNHEKISKTTGNESGTCVSLLIPGGTTAKSAWPRLKNYFQRFQINTEMQCRLEVFAPSLCNTPLFICPFLQQDVTIKENIKEIWNDDLDNGDEMHQKFIPVKTKPKSQHILRRKKICRAIEKFIQAPLDLNNVAHSSHPIRLAKERSKRCTYMEVDVIICGPNQTTDTQSNATLQLIRMVNGIPLLDGAEASACGLIQAMERSVWGSYGLQLTRSVETEDWVPTFDVRDCDHLLPFFQNNNNTHSRWEPNKTQNFDEANESCEFSRRPSSKLLPALVRLGKLIVVVHIHATPSELPLPTLSKGRLPLNHGPISQTLQVCLKECLRKLQATNSELFLSSSQLRKVERDVCFIPDMAGAISKIIGNIKTVSFQTQLINTITAWDETHTVDLTERSLGYDIRHGNSQLSPPDLSKLLENRLRLSVRTTEQSKHLVRQSTKRKRAKSSSTRKGASIKAEDYDELDSSDGEQTETIIISQNTCPSNPSQTRNENNLSIFKSSMDFLEDIESDDDTMSSAFYNRPKLDSSKANKHRNADDDDDDEWW